MPGTPTATEPGSISPATGTVEPAWVDDVLRFWFEELSSADWFRKDEAIDARIRERFLSLHARLLAGELAPPDTPRGLLAAVLVLDQFSRNLFRHDARAYAADPVARRIAQTAIGHGFDAVMALHQRQFFYLPFEHSEDPRDQRMAVSLTEPLGDPEMIRYAIAHQRIIDRFGRFPHRNAILGRRSTPEEIEFLKLPMSSF
jgi:uncharacterized protein (DUF924 family)